ncbi:5'-methylthioadenosine/S-adenosylhomocysteine nucleosidase [Blautia schinkii]|uniref:5'-methylthioadenosine/S-adenosylhomocysteine nucleosidase n=1 Tax=Blautia schinkii TaxID=180164 RepID=UPI0015712DF9|nr:MULTISPECIES: 5'-methylthioadenosine/S-adenosylhomocysteine nucleosidase [Clostridia]NSK36941.1 5'-methylthioadenosine/S-adenosylhomocysteine nucleosidase [Blautia schinkii]NSK67092.1 5'-methylthioadenosine/S-adenosylhomocysteine nucleosidase [Blautia schinkii]
MRIDNIFIYHLDYELQELFHLTKAYSYKKIYSCFNLVTRMAFLLCDKSILIPASNYFESNIAFSILNRLCSLSVNKLDTIKLVSSSYNLDELLDKKIIQHGNSIKTDGYHYVDFIENKKNICLPGTMKKRNASASKDIQVAWLKNEGIEVMAKKIYEIVSGCHKASAIEDKLFSIPSKLGNQAYISRYIVPLLELGDDYNKPVNTVVNLFITREYIKSFLDEYHAVCLKDIPLIDAELILPSGKEYNHLSYMDYAKKLYELDYKGIRALDFIEQCSAEELYEYKESSQWKRVIEYKNKKDIILPPGIKKENRMLKTEDIKIGIITALPKEFAAVKMLLENSKEYFLEGKGAGHRFLVGEIKSANDGVHKVALGLCGMGNNKASIRAMNMHNHFENIESIIMVGIAGGIPSPDDSEKHVRLGDIVVSKGIVQYDFVKETDESIICRSEPAIPSATLLEALNAMEIKEYDDIYKWREYIDQYAVKKFKKPSCEDLLHDENGKIISHPYDEERNGYPKVFHGKIASANTLLKSYKKRQQLKEEFGVYAVEMEASGIADTTWEMGTGYIVIRGICDYCDEYKNDDWQEYAALAAASYARDLIENLPS